MAVAPLGSITNTYAHYVCGDADGSWYEAGNWECQWNELWGCPCYYNVETGEMVWTLSETGAEVRRGGSSWVLPSDAACPDQAIGHHAPLAVEEDSSEEQPWDWEQHWSEQFNCSLYYDTKTKDIRFSPSDRGPPSLEEVAREVFGIEADCALDEGAEEAGPSEESEALAEAHLAATADGAVAPAVAATADVGAGEDLWSQQGCDSKLEVAADAVAAAAHVAAAVAAPDAGATASAEAALGDDAEAAAEAAAEAVEAVEAEVQDVVQARTAEGARSQQGPASEPEAPVGVTVAVAVAAGEPAEAAPQPRAAESPRSQQRPAPEPEAPEVATPPGQDEDARGRDSEDEVASASCAAATAEAVAAVNKAAVPVAAAAAEAEAEAGGLAEVQAAAKTRAPEGGESWQDYGSQPEVREVVAVPEHQESPQSVPDVAVVCAAEGRAPAPAARAAPPAGDGAFVPCEQVCIPSEVMQRFSTELERRRRDCERLRKVVLELAEKDQKMEARARKVNRILEELRQHATKRVEKVTQDMEELRLQHSAELAELRAEVRRFRHRNAELRQGSGKVSSPRKIISSIPRPLVNSSPRVPKRNGSLPRKGTVTTLVSSFSSVATAAPRVLGAPTEAPPQPVGGRPSVRCSTGGAAGRSNGW